MQHLSVVGFIGCVTILCLGVHHQFAIHKVNAVRPCFPWRFDHLFLLGLRKVGDLVYGFQVVGSVRNAEGDGELEALDEFVTEVVPFDHDEISHRVGSHLKR